MCSTAHQTYGLSVITILLPAVLSLLTTAMFMKCWDLGEPAPHLKNPIRPDALDGDGVLYGLGNFEFLFFQLRCFGKRFDYRHPSFSKRFLCWASSLLPFAVWLVAGPHGRIQRQQMKPVFCRPLRQPLNSVDVALALFIE